MTQHSQTDIWSTDAQRGDRLALAKLLAAHHPQLRARAESRLAGSLKARGGPDDVLQEVYLQVFRQFHVFEDRGPNAFLNWVFTILDHKLIDLQRAAHRQVRNIDREVTRVAAGSGSSSYWNLLDQIHADTTTPSRVVRRDEAVGALLACLSRLSEPHRRVLQLRFLDGLSVEEVAAQLGKSKGAVVALSQRALESLRTAMSEMGEFTRGT